MHRSGRAGRSICGACGLQAASGRERDERKGDDCQGDFADHENSLPAAAAERLPDLFFFFFPRRSLAGFGVDTPAARGNASSSVGFAIGEFRRLDEAASSGTVEARTHGIGLHRLPGYAVETDMRLRALVSRYPDFKAEPGFETETP